MPGIEDRFSLPLLGDFFYQSANGANPLRDKKNDLAKEQFYQEAPPLGGRLGYDEQYNVYSISMKPSISELDLLLGTVDGDTCYFDLSTARYDGCPKTRALLEEIAASMKSAWKEFYGADGGAVAAKLGEETKAVVRLLCVDTPEIPHWSILNGDIGGFPVKTAMYAAVVKDTRYAVCKTDRETGCERKPEDLVHLINIETDKSGPQWYEYFLRDGKIVMLNNDQSDPVTLRKGYKMRDLLKNELAGADQILIVCSGLIQRDMAAFPSRYNTSSFSSANYKNALYNAIDFFQSASSFLYSGFRLAGLDLYGRMLAVVYYKTADGIWCNLNKRIACEAENGDIKVNASAKDGAYESLNGSFVSSVLAPWSYDYAAAVYADRVFQNNDREIPPYLLEHTLTLGDVTLLVPPTSIRCVSQTTSERVPLIRAAGTMTKSSEKAEKIIELELYFADDAAINGTKTAEPSGNENAAMQKEYYLNGLNALIAQFKFCPFLPLENEYVNKALGVDAVSMENLVLQTVPGFPRLLKAVLTLREFEYRIYMPEIPADRSKTDVNQAAEASEPYRNYFAKSICYPLLRFYYQRAIERGRAVQNMEINAQAREDVVFGRTALEPYDCNSADSRIRFFVPNKEHLDKLLQVKLEAMRRPLGESYTLTQSEKSLAAQISSLYQGLTNFVNSGESKDKIEALNAGLAAEGLCQYYLRTANEEVYEAQLNSLREIMRAEINGQADQAASEALVRNLNAYAGALKSCLSVVKDETGKPIAAWVKTALRQLDGKLQVGVLLALNNNLAAADSAVSTLKKVASKKVGAAPESFFCGGQLFLPICAAVQKNRIVHMQPVHKILQNEYAFDTAAADCLFMEFCNAYAQKTGNADDEAAALAESISIETSRSIVFDELDTGEVSMGEFSVTLGNHYSRIALNAYHGCALQYVGGQDSVIEVNILTMNRKAAACLGRLPVISADYTRNYRLVLPVFPLRIDSRITRFLGITDVTVEEVQVDTVPATPGLYSIHLRLLTVNRTLRNKEIMQRRMLNHFTSLNPGAFAQAKKAAFFEVRDMLAEAELYPDLELPTKEELLRSGFELLRYKAQNRKYADPDFYFLYPQALTSEIVRNAVLSVFQAGTDDPELFKTNFQFSDGRSVGYNVYDDEDRRKKAEGFGGRAEHSAMGLGNNDAYQAELKKDPFDPVRLDADIYESWDISKEIRCIFLETKYLAQFNKAHGIVAEGETQLNQNPKDPQEFLIRAEPVKNDGQWLSQKLNDFSTGLIKKINEILSSPIQTAQYFSIDANQTAEEQLKALRETDLRKLSDLYRNMPLNTREAISQAERFAALFVDDFSGYDPLGTKTSVAANLFYGSDFSKLLFAAACAKTAVKEYARSEEHWLPNVIGIEGDLTAESIGYMLDHAVEFGLFKTKLYDRNEIAQILQEDLERDEAAVSAEDRFLIDDYYRNCKDPNVLRIYKFRCCFDKAFAYSAFAREILFWLRFMLRHDLLPSVIYDVFNQSIGQREKIEEIAKKILGAAANSGNMKLYIDDVKENLRSINNGKVFAAACLAVTNGDGAFYRLYKSRDYQALNAIARNAVKPARAVYDGADISSRTVRKFILALAGGGIIHNVGDVGGSGEPVMGNILRDQLKIAADSAMNDPKIYLRDSFYDMLRHDCRGRMLRAFPTFYMTFIDEGRKIGCYKLHDNFYNSNAISQIQITKSRKIAADTAIISMTNFFKTYTDKDEDMPSEYEVNWDEIWGSLYYPAMGEYAQSQEERRRDAAQPNQMKLRPGARVHIRMGYGADAANLPIVFNGSVSEVETGDFVNIIAQGDGGELCNPIPYDVDLQKLVNYDNTDIMGIYLGKNSVYGQKFTPKTILTKILTCQGGSWNRYLHENQGEGVFMQYINDDLIESFGESLNPFGIVHFGARDYTRVFTDGEAVQNIYEAAPIGKKTGFFMQPTDIDKIPEINFDIAGKSLWDILHICRTASTDYIASVAPFGFRSTVFYGPPRAYYAYDYIEYNGTVLEKRKPFRQFHLYTSFSDIIDNKIKATDKNIKTCAIGLYEVEGFSSDRVAKQTQRLWVDEEIFPENQKTMIYNTCLYGKSSLNTGTGDLPLIQPYLDKLSGLVKGVTNDWCDMMYSDVNSDAVSYDSLAAKMTIEALKDTVKDMYTGELILLGDPSVKPCDRILLQDSYELMQGQCEVKEVVHTLSCETGFTTVLYPDCIAVVDKREEETLQVHNAIVKTAAGAAVTCSSAASAFAGKALMRELLCSSSVGMVAVTMANDWLERRLKYSRCMTIFPLMKSSKPLTAGLEGSQGLVFGSASYHSEGFLRTFVSSFLSDGYDGFLAGVKDFLVSDDLKKVANAYMSRNGAENGGQKPEFEALEQVGASAVGGNLNAGYLNLNLPRVAKNTPENVKKLLYAKLCLKNTEDINANTALQFLHYIPSDRKLTKYLQSGFLWIAHNGAAETFGGVRYEEVEIAAAEGAVKTKCLIGKNEDGTETKDIPFLSSDALKVLDLIVSALYRQMDEIKTGDRAQRYAVFGDSHVILLSGTIVNAKNNRASSGYMFKIKATGQVKNGIEAVLIGLEEQNKKLFSQSMAAYEAVWEHLKLEGGSYIVSIAPPAAR